MRDGRKQWRQRMHGLSRRRLLQLSAALPGLGRSVFDVVEYGAAQDGASKSTQAIQEAIDLCSARGGGVVFFPAGDYVSGTLRLRSNVSLHLSPGATLGASDDLRDYAPRHLLYAHGASCIAIQGRGTIDGSGSAFFGDSIRPADEARPGPMIELVECQRVLIEDVVLRDSPWWTVHPKQCSDLRIRGVSIRNPIHHRNTDGIVVDSCRNVIISGCTIEAGDDCIALKATDTVPWRPEGYGLPPAPCERVIVRDCILTSAAAGLKLGTESHADITMCRFSDCMITDSTFGIALFAKDGGSFEDLSFSDISILTVVRRDSQRTEWPLVVDLSKRSAESAPSRIRNVSFENIRVKTRGRVLVTGLRARPIERLVFEQLDLEILATEDLGGVIQPSGGAGQPRPEDAEHGAAPAAIVIADTNEVDIRGLRLDWSVRGTLRERHAMLARRVGLLEISGFHGRQATPKGSLSTILFDNISRARVSASRAAPGTGTFLRLRGINPEAVILQGNDLDEATQTLASGEAGAHDSGFGSQKR